MAYDSSSDALRRLLLLRGHGGHITKSPEKILTLPNGLTYYYVEVYCKQGEIYIIEAYGEEALELYNESKGLEQIRMLVTV